MAAAPADADLPDIPATPDNDDKLDNMVPKPMSENMLAISDHAA